MTEREIIENTIVPYLLIGRPDKDGRWTLWSSTQFELQDRNTTIWCSCGGWSAKLLYDEHGKLVGYEILDHDYPDDSRVHPLRFDKVRFTHLKFDQYKDSWKESEPVPDPDKNPVGPTGGWQPREALPEALEAIEALGRLHEVGLDPLSYNGLVLQKVTVRFYTRDGSFQLSDGWGKTVDLPHLQRLLAETFREHPIPPRT